MQLEEVRLKLVRSKSGFKESELLAKDCLFLSLPAKKNSLSLRKFFKDSFGKACQRQKEKILFSAENFKDFAYSSLFSKIAAQELFRLAKNKKRVCLKQVCFVVKTRQIEEVLKKNLINYWEHLKNNPGPFLTVDGIVQYRGGIVLVKRTNPPLGWALPGGFVDYGESLEAAVAREVKEEINLDFKAIKQFKAYSAEKRDPRFHTVSIVFFGEGRGRLKAASDAKDARVFLLKGRDSLEELPEDIAFDHKKIIKEWFLSR